jgi:hypothetical protein
LHPRGEGVGHPPQVASSVALTASPSTMTSTAGGAVLLDAIAHRGSAARFLAFRVVSAVMKETPPSSHRPRIGRPCGRPSGDTVANQ